MKGIISWHKRRTRIAIILILTIVIQVVIPILTNINIVNAVTRTCGDGATFKNLMDNANDGDVIEITNNFSCGNEFRIKNNCLVTLDLNNNTITFNINDAFEIGANSALLVKNGTLDKLDTSAGSAGIIILDGVTISSNIWLGHTVTWIINNSRIAHYSTEQGSINGGASSLHPVGSGANGNNYNYENSTPAMIGSGTNWTVNSDLSAEFNTVNSNSAIYNNVILLKDSTLTSDANLTASGITMDFSEYSMTTGDYFKISNDSGTNIIRNGTVNGNIDLSNGNGNIVLSNMNVTGDIYNNTHTVEISSGTYNNISSNAGKVIITGGYFVNKPDQEYLEDGYSAIPCDVNIGGIIYNYHVVQAYTVTFDANGHGTAPDIQEIEKGHTATKPTDPIEPKYTFEGWYEESTCITPYNFYAPVNSDITLYAKWTLNTITDDMVNISDNTQTYDGMEYSINVTNTTDATISYGITEETYDLEEPPKYKDVGTYIIYYKVTKDNYVDKTGYAVLTIEPAIITEIAFDNNEVTYDGEEHTIKVTGGLTGGTIKYGLEEGIYDLDKLPKYTDIGTYTIYYKATKDNYIDKIGTATITINPMPITVKAKDKIITYGDETPIFDYEVINGSLVTGEELSNINVSQLAETNAGTYIITVSQIEGSNSNYDITFENGTYTINKKEITPEVELNQPTFTYNVEDQKPNVSVKYNGKDLPLSEYLIQFTEDSTNVGNKQAIVSSQNVNYIFTDVVKEYVINPKAIDSSMVTIDKRQYVYDTKIKEPVIILKYEDTVLSKDIDYEVLDRSTISAKDAGNYNIIVKGKGNYAEEYTVPWTITKAMISGVEINGVETIYDGQNHNIDVTIPNNAKISFKTSVDSEYSNENPKFKDAGNYTVYYKVEIDNNYEVIENSAKVIITPKDVQVSADDKEKVYGEKDPELKYTAKGLVGFEKLEGITLSREAGEDVGAYTIIASKDTSKDLNYNIILNNGTLTIKKKEAKNPNINIITENIIYTGNKIEPQIVIKDNNDNIIPDNEYTVTYSNNRNAGEATITITNKDGGNYVVNGRKTFTINPKAINNPKIEFDQTEYKYTGSEIKPEITVRDEGIIISPDEYTISYSNNISDGQATAIITNKKNSNYIFNITVPFEIVKPGAIQIVNSNVPNANKAKLGDDFNSLYSKIYFTDEELEKQARGKNIDIYLEVKDISKIVSAEDKQAIMGKITENIGAYLDVSLFKKITGEDATKITNTKEPITITFEIPENLINNDPNINRTYAVVRLHEGIVTKLNTKVENNTITFETDEFSTYALVYSDENATDVVNTVIARINLIDLQKLIGGKSRIALARDSYDTLSDTQKELVTNYEILVRAENEYNQLYNQAISNSKK